MPSVRSLLTRVQKLEQDRRPLKSPIEQAYGSFDAFADEVQVRINAGELDGIDMPLVLNCLGRWHQDEIWQQWRRDRIWEKAR